MDTKGQKDALNSQAYYADIQTKCEYLLTEFARILHPHVTDINIIKRVALKSLEHQKEVNNSIIPVDPKFQTQKNKILLDTEECIKAVKFEFEQGK